MAGEHTTNSVTDAQDAVIARFDGPERGRSRNPLIVEARRTVAVIDLLIELHHRVPQPSELALLTSWQGWGSLAPAYGRPSRVCQVNGVTSFSVFTCVPR